MNLRKATAQLRVARMSRRSDTATRAEKRSRGARTRLRSAYKPMFVDAVTRIISREVKDLRGLAKKHLLRGNIDEFDKALSPYYDDFRSHIVKVMLPVMSSYGEAIHVEASDEINSGVNQGEINTFVSKYADMYASRHVGRSIKKIRTILDDHRSIRASVDDLSAISDELDGEFDDWEEERPDQDAMNETVREDNAIAKETFVLGGITTLVWQANANACPICQEMDGKVVGIDMNFLSAGDEMDVPGLDSPFAIESDAGHPPLHGGCVCEISPA